MEGFSLAKPTRESPGHKPDDRALNFACVPSLLQQGKINACERLFRGSNGIFLLSIERDGDSLKAIYKPRSEETPLYDFPTGTLYRREYAAYLVSQALQWSFVPPSVIRDGPLGIGVVQWLVDTRSGSNYEALVKNYPAELKRVAVFDWLVNNADRKSSHCLLGRDGKLWAIDHGLTFHIVPKLRTVIWDFQGQPVPEELLADLRLFRRQLTNGSALVTELSQLLASGEVEALRKRLDIIINCPVFPGPSDSYRSMPWPPFGGLSETSEEGIR